MIDSLRKNLDPAVTASLENAPGGRATVFFRADDIGEPDQPFFRLLDLFDRFRLPLALAVVPTWIDAPKWERINRVAGRHPELWCWHQHGYRHVNHEPTGKKQEFGPSRNRDDMKSDLILGRRTLEGILGKRFFPVFTPPWNRCSLIALELLSDLGYHAVSRHQNVKPACPEALPDWSVNVDLHTRKEATPHERWAGTSRELTGSLAGGFCGIMIHHQRMDDDAFLQLEMIIEILEANPRIDFVKFPDLLKG